MTGRPNNWNGLTPEERLISKREIDADGCWIWTGLVVEGYGQICWAGKSMGVHRASHLFFVGPIPDGHSVLHHCDKPLCFRPECLFTGTQQDNIDDMIAKGRGRYLGEDNARSKMTNERVRLMRSLREQGVSGAELARRFECSTTLVFNICTRKTWRHVA